jgi:gluconate 2-dehydrogenase gamma chain
MADDTIPRRDFLKGAVGAVGTAAAITTVGSEQAQAQPAPAASPAPASTATPDDEPLLTLTATEHAFIVAAVDSLIPADQLAGAYGMGARLYRQGPFPTAKSELGYQLSLNPREFFRAGIEATNAWSRKTYGKDFDRLSEKDREAALKAMEEGKAEFAGFGSRMFFDALLQITMEGFFSDPIYGGNRDMASWKMIGYPGLPATYREEIKTYFGKKYDKAPRSIADFT